MNYHQVLDEAIGDSPPSTVDVDAVITRQRRAGRLRRWGASGAGVATGLAVVLAATQILPGHAPTEVAGDGRITTVAGTPEDMARLDNALFGVLGREVPNLKWRDSPAPDIPGWGHTRGAESTLVGYYGNGGISVDGVEALLVVQIHRHGAQRAMDSPCVDYAAMTCRESRGPQGERVWTRIEVIRAPEFPASQRRVVSALRSDDTMAQVTLMHVRTPGDFPMTAEQQTAIAVDPALTLAPVPPGARVRVPTPTPTDSPGTTEVKPTATGANVPIDPDQQRRIDNAVFASLRRQAPAVTGADPGPEAPVDLAAAWERVGEGRNTVDNYFGRGRITVNGVAGLFVVTLYREDPGFGDLSCGQASKTYTCTTGQGRHGERYQTATNTERSGSTVSAQRVVVVMRTDGSVSTVALIANGPDGKFALTAAQQQAIALDRAIALAGR